MIEEIAASFATELPREIAVAVNQVSFNYSDTLLFKLGDCIVTVGYGYITERGKDMPWATIYHINENSEDDTRNLLAALKKIHEDHGYDFGLSFAHTTKLKHIVYKLGIKEREQGTGKTFELE